MYFCLVLVEHMPYSCSTVTLYLRSHFLEFVEIITSLQYHVKMPRLWISGIFHISQVYTKSLFTEFQILSMNCLYNFCDSILA